MTKPCANASPTCPMPICNVPPSRTRPAACSPMAYLVSPIGSDGGANSGKSVAGLSSTALNSSAGKSPAPGMQRGGIMEIGVSSETAVDHWRSEALLDQVLRLRLFQRPRGKQGQADRAIGDRARVERIDDVVGLAEPKRQPDHQIGPDIADN